MPRTKQFDHQEVLQKAQELFWKQGFHATSVQNLVDHLGINRASLYQTFGGKNELYEAALQAYRKEARAFLEEKLASHDSAKKALYRLFKEALQESIDDPDRKGCFVVNCTTEYLPTHPHILTDLINNKSQFQKTIGKTLQKGKAQGEFSKDLNIVEMSGYLFTFFNGLKITAKVQQDKKALFKTIEIGLQVLD